MAKILMVLFVACGLPMSVSAQENSPYSRYGLGDLTPNHNVFTRGMAGVSAGVTDNNSINFTNPASLAVLYNTVFDVGTEIDYRILKSSNPAKKFTSANTYVNYLQMAFPLTTRKMAKKNITWAMSLGLKPVTKINYKIEKNERLTTIDSLNTLYEGSGGVNQAFFGTGLKYKNLSVGINAGYMFGSKNYTTILSFINDTTFYYKSLSSTKATFGGFFINAGLQYDIPLVVNGTGLVEKNLRIGVYGNLQQNLKASSNLTRDIIFYDQNGVPVILDSVYHEDDVKGTIKYPAMVGLGAAYTDANWMLGADVEYGNWASYRYYGQSDEVQNSLMFRVGAQYIPAKPGVPITKYFKSVKYRAGIYYGSDYIKTNSKRPDYGFTIGAGMPLTSRKTRSAEYVVLNTALEFGNRGSKQAGGLRENIFRFSIGLSMNARWFLKPKYN